MMRMNVPTARAGLPGPTTGPCRRRRPRFGRATQSPCSPNGRSALGFIRAAVLAPQGGDPSSSGVAVRPGIGRGPAPGGGREGVRRQVRRMWLSGGPEPAVVSRGAWPSQRCKGPRRCGCEGRRDVVDRRPRVRGYGYAGPAPRRLTVRRAVQPQCARRRQVTPLLRVDDGWREWRAPLGQLVTVTSIRYPGTGGPPLTEA